MGDDDRSKNDTAILCEIVLGFLMFSVFSDEDTVDPDEGLRMFENASGTLKEMSFDTRLALGKLCRKAAAERPFPTLNEEEIQRWLLQYADELERGR